MTLVESARRDLHYAIRGFRHRPGPAGAALLVLALGTGICIPFLTIVHSGLIYSRSSGDAIGVIQPGVADGLGLWSPDAETVGTAQMAHLEILLWTLGAAAILVLAIVSINLLILLLSRGTARREEMALRSALGATRVRLMRQLLVEGTLLVGIGGAFGWAIGTAGLSLARATWPSGMHLWIGDGPGAEVIGMALVLPAAVVLIAALAPARGASRKDLYRALPGGRSSAGRGERILRNFMVMMAVAASMTLLVGAGLLVRSFAAEQAHLTIAYPPGDALVINIELPAEDGSSAPRAALVSKVLDEVRAVPGVEAESLATTGSLLGLGPSDEVRAICDFCARSSVPLFIIDGISRHHAVSPGYFHALGLQPIRGRDFRSTDGPGAPLVAIVSETFGYRIFPRGDPIGNTVRIGGPGGAWATVVGIVPDVRARGIGTGAQPAPSLYLPALQYPPSTAVLTVRTAGDPKMYADSVSAAIRRAGASLISDSSPTLEQRVSLYEAPLHWLSRVFAVLAACAVILVVLGLHGVISFQVRQRTREVGIRMALGAQPRSVLRLIVGESVRLTATGAYLGLMGAFTLARLLQIYVLGVEPLDPITYGCVVLLLAGVAFVASAVPAKEAARTDPLVALRYE